VLIVDPATCSEENQARCSDAGGVLVNGVNENKAKQRRTDWLLPGAVRRCQALSSYGNLLLRYLETLGRAIVASN
jgi:hypothetical protein